MLESGWSFGKIGLSIFRRELCRPRSKEELPEKVGEVLNYLLPLPIPASIYGIVIMFAALLTGVIPLDSIKETAKFLIAIMPIMFVAPAVGLIDAWDLIKGSLVQYLILILGSTFLVMGLTGMITQLMLNKGSAKGGEDHA